MMKLELRPFMVEKAVENWMPGARVRSIEDVSGIAHRTYLVEIDNPEKSVALKFCFNPKLEDDFKAEPYVTELVRHTTTVPAPKVVFTDLNKSYVNYPYYVSEKMEGRNPERQFKYMPVKIKKKLLRNAGNVLARLHRDSEYSKFGFIRARNGLYLDERQDWSSTLRDVVNNWLRELLETPFRYLVPEIREAVEKRMWVVSGNYRPRLLHRDFRPGNLLIENGDITGLMDWERTFMGHKEYDLFKAEREFLDLYFEDEELKREYRQQLYEGYTQVEELEKGWRQRRKFYRYLYAVEHLAAYKDWEKIHPDEDKRIAREKQLVEQIRNPPKLEKGPERLRINVLS